MADSFWAAQARGDHWGTAVKACLDAMGSATGHNLGFLYVTPDFAEDLPSIVTFLTETTSIRMWVGGSGHSVWGPDGPAREGTIVVMLARIEPAAMRLFEGGEMAGHEDWLEQNRPAVALVHGDPKDPGVVEQLATLAADSGTYLVGGLTAAPGSISQVAGRAVESSVSGLLLGSGVTVLTGLSQGCSPIGPVHQVSDALSDVLIALDDRPALEVLKEDAGQIIARDLRKAAGYIHAAIPVAGSDTGDYVVRNLVGIDPKRGWLAVGAELMPGEHLMFVRRDPNTAQKDFTRMLRHLAGRVGGRSIRGGLYISCVARGAHMFGTDNRECEMIREHLGRFPLIGFAANGEINAGRLYAYTGILVLFL